MLVSEEEAKKKVCKVTASQIMPRQGVAVGTEAIMQYGWGQCHGSLCMQWRWYGTLVKPEGEVNLGYCGLAGVPSNAPTLIAPTRN